jgi:FtsZ-interacting cell division protein ZipA
LLIAIGAILAVAVTVHNPNGFNINTAGIILMIIGAVGLVVSVVWMTARRRSEVVHEMPQGTSRTRDSEPSPAEF